MKRLINRRGSVTLTTIVAALALALTGCANNGVKPFDIGTVEKVTQQVTCDTVVGVSNAVAAADEATAPGKRGELRHWGLNPDDPDGVKAVRAALLKKAKECTPTAAPTTTPGDAKPTPTSSTTPGQTETDPPGTATHVTAQDGIKGWDNVLALIEKQNATDQWQKLIDESQEDTGFRWSDVQQWASTKVDGKPLGARLVVVFGLNSSELSDDAAREAVGVSGTQVPVIRAQRSYQDLVLGQSVAPPDGDRAVLFIAPLGEQNGELALRPKSGVALVPNPDKEGGLQLTLATYQVA